ncbi:unnamed protein product [Euphydryas editha]|uniref:Uncharacterized protein n=1 Tax=Euphydryas editha TaxID=104508 RepID=A0AAU9V9R0_EUPED|nr:unnamed protein product [Euphydryas editha]
MPLQLSLYCYRRRAALTLHDERGGVNYAAAGRYCLTEIKLRLDRGNLARISSPLGERRRTAASCERGEHCGEGGIFHADGAIEPRSCACVAITHYHLTESRKDKRTL